MSARAKLILKLAKEKSSREYNVEKKDCWKTIQSISGSRNISEIKEENFQQTIEGVFLLFNI